MGKKIPGEETKIETKTVRTSKFRFNNKVRRANWRREKRHDNKWSVK